MLIDQLGLPIAAQKHAEIIKPSDNTLQLNTIYEKDRHGNLRLPDVIQEGVLEVLLVGSHCFMPFLFMRRYEARNTITGRF